MVIGVLALQGAVSEHCRALDSLQVINREVRNLDDIVGVDGLIMPGGESTTLRKLLKNTGLWKFILECELPILGTCAGAILLGKSNDETFQKMDFTIDRNFYGRQIDSFEEILEVENYPNFRGVFIRAPAITDVGKTKPIAYCNGEIVGCTDGKNMALTFHPELTSDSYFHEMWLRNI
ncbi:MAG: pyridoxal 5'-phosphate synthase glutaminase subunit PdxT [Methanobacteriota archaeon]|nr:MAG: pyridoxal 5'-phosphate synthase glutaminase subunit PdxT [Euryarchaeota archaeon]